MMESVNKVTKINDIFMKTRSKEINTMFHTAAEFGNSDVINCIIEQLKTTYEYIDCKDTCYHQTINIVNEIGNH